MVHYVLTVYFRDGSSYRFDVNPAEWGGDEHTMPEGEWLAPSVSHPGTYRDAPGYLRRFVKMPLGAAMVEHLGTPWGVRCEGTGVL
jgi:hypothetical protein